VQSVAGGVSNGNHAPGLLSLGTLFNNAIWTFYHSSQSIEHLPQLKGKRIAVGPVGSATRQIAEKILGPVGVSESTATFSPFIGVAAAEAMKDRKVDVVFVLVCFGENQDFLAPGDVLKVHDRLRGASCG
jgi:TRAP-type uncharacterized transport system substrate-binding protein